MTEKRDMDHHLINKWLEIPNQEWPPNHYALLGLDRCAADVKQIEQAVHDRLAKLRCYQLSHPDLATTAMNQLAQAFMCLTDARAKAAYDESSAVATAVLPPPNETESPSTPSNGTDHGRPTPVMPKSLLDTDVPSKTKIDWQTAPPPIRVNHVAPAPPPPPPPVQPVEKKTPVAQPADQDVNKAKASLDARRGLATIPAVLKRIDHTRQLLWAWEKIGRRLKKPPTKPTRALEIDFNHWLEEIAAWLTGFPQILGQPGQPGYRVVALTRLEVAFPMVQAMDEEQKKDLMCDWKRGREILTQHRRFLRFELKRMRNRSFLGRTVSAVHTAIDEHLWLTLLGASFVAAVTVWFIASR